jgi:DNA gyrase/topoisomerase IV subunit A
VKVPTPERQSHESETSLHLEVEKRYLAYALSTIVSRALPDVRDGLKPVHRRILYAMHSMRLNDTAKMRKSAAVVGEVIGKYHPHGDQAAYDALVRMAQDFSLRYPLIQGSGNFGSVDGDSPAAMRYTETRLSPFAGFLLREIDQGTTDFHPTYDAMGDEPDVFPAMVPNLLLNGSSGIAVGMSCSFPPHNLGEIMAACRATIRKGDLDTRQLLQYVSGPDFPTGGEILDDPNYLAEVYTTGHGAIRIRGTFHVETVAKGRENVIIDSIPYSVNKSRLIERIAQLIKDKKLKYVQDVRDESTAEVRIVLELRGGDVSPESVVAFLFKHSDLQINFPVNLIAITPQGVPDRLGLGKIIRYFLDFRYEKTVLRLNHRLEQLQKRIHLLEGFDALFQDLDKAIKIIRSARSRQEAEEGLKREFPLDDEQVEAILEMRLYRLVGMEIGKLLDELTAKRKEERDIAKDLASPERLWNIIDGELSEISTKFADPRRTRIVEEKHAAALDYNPEEFVEYEDATVILSRQGWIRRMKSEVEDDSALKFRESDGLFGWARVNTARPVAIFSNLGKVYVIKAIDIPATSGYGEPIGSIMNFGDGEFVVGMIAPESTNAAAEEQVSGDEPDERGREDEIVDESLSQYSLFGSTEPEPEPESELTEPAKSGVPARGILVTKLGQGFRFEFSIIHEPTKRAGRRLVNLKEGDEVLTVKPETGELAAIAADSGRLLLFPVEQITVLSGPGQGVRLMRLPEGAQVISFEMLDPNEELKIHRKRGKEKVVPVKTIEMGRRAGAGKAPFAGIIGIERQTGAREQPE